MKNKPCLPCYFSLAFLIVFLFSLATGCSKKTDTPAATAPTATDATAVVQAAPSNVQPSANSTAINSQIAEANVAMQTKDYEKARTALSIQPQSADQVAAYNRAKGVLEMQVRAAAAAGDPNAKAALEKIQQDYSNHR